MPLTHTDDLHDEFEGHDHALARMEEHAQDTGIGSPAEVTAPAETEAAASPAKRHSKLTRKISNIAPLTGESPSGASEPAGAPMSPRTKLNAFRNHNGSLARSVGQYSMRRLIMQVRERR